MSNCKRIQPITDQLRTWISISNSNNNIDIPCNWSIDAGLVRNRYCGSANHTTTLPWLRNLGAADVALHCISTYDLLTLSRSATFQMSAYQFAICLKFLQLYCLLVDALRSTHAAHAPRHCSFIEMTTENTSSGGTTLPGGYYKGLIAKLL